VLLVALAHDFVLRRNCRVAFSSDEPDAFTKSTHGSHHIHLVSSVAGLWNSVLAKEKGKAAGGKQLRQLPQLPIIDSGENFGLVESNYSTTFKGLIEVKEEPEDEGIPYLPSLDDDEIQNLLRELNIDPSLLHLPSSSGSSGSIQPPTTILMSDQRDKTSMSHQRDMITFSGGASTADPSTAVHVDGEKSPIAAASSPVSDSLDPRPKRKAVNSGQADPLNGDKAATKKARIEIPLSADTVVSRFSQRSHKSFTHIWCVPSDPNYRNPNCRQHSSLLQGHQSHPRHVNQQTHPKVKSRRR
jgi:hypothetical protein